LATRALQDARVWILLLALVCFAVGVTTGLFLARAGEHAPLSSGGPFEEYRSSFTQRFHLDGRRERLFAELLRNYAKDIEEARTRVLRPNQPELERELVEIGHRYRGLIRDHVLPPEQRAEYDSLEADWQTIQ
jgi:hypothetical protein